MDPSTTNVRLNEDVLHEIMQYLGTHEQITAVRVCKAWTIPAQKMLYRSVAFHSWIRSPDSSEVRLKKTLQKYPHLRPLVRQVTVSCTPRLNSSPLDEFQWLEILPEHSLRNFTYHAQNTYGSVWLGLTGAARRGPSPSSFSPALLYALPAVRTVPHLTANGPSSDAALKACFELPYLETLELNLSAYGVGAMGCGSTAALDPAHAPLLRDLYIYVPTLPAPVVNSIITAFAPQLYALHIHVPPARPAFSASDPGRPKWDVEFVRHVRNSRSLRRVVFSGFLSWTASVPVEDADGDEDADAEGQKAERAYGPPFLDAIGAEGSPVEHLCCIEGLYSARLFDRLSRGVQVLEFYADENTFRHEDALLALVARAGRDGLGLRTVRFFGPEERRVVFANIKEACEAGGVEFRFVPVVTPLHNPPTRPPIVWD